MLLAGNFYSQVGIGTTNPSPKSMLEVSSQTNGAGPYKGLMPPRVPNNAARNAINPSAGDIGLLIFVESTQCLQMWSGTEWQNIKCITVPNTWPAIQNFETTGADYELPLYSAIGGFYPTDTGYYPNTSLFVSPVRGYGVSKSTATVILGPIDASSATSATFRLRLGAFSSTSFNGMEATDTVLVSIGVDGPTGAFTNELLIRGNNNAQWGFNNNGSVTTDYSTAQATFSAGPGTTGGISYLEITGIPNSENLAIKIVMFNNIDNELWLIDDAEIYGN